MVATWPGVAESNVIEALALKLVWSVGEIYMGGGNKVNQYEEDLLARRHAWTMRSFKWNQELVLVDY